LIYSIYFIDVAWFSHDLFKGRVRMGMGGVAVKNDISPPGADRLVLEINRYQRYNATRKQVYQ
jgi:hypothetical protein